MPSPASKQPYTLVGRPGARRARIRFPGCFEGTRVVWDALILALDPADDSPQFIEVGEAGANGRAVTVGLKVPELDAATFIKITVMLRNYNYKRLHRGRHEFAVPAATRLRVKRVLSGGQTGVDRAALDAARACGLGLSGWCPRGRRAEDGRIPDDYPLVETRTADYRERTRRNVLASDATLVLTRGDPTGGTAYTLAIARRARKPYLLVDLDQAPIVEQVRVWLAAQRVESLNVAGPRESMQPGIYAQARAFLQRLLEAEHENGGR